MEAIIEFAKKTIQTKEDREFTVNYEVYKIENSQRLLGRMLFIVMAIFENGTVQFIVTDGWTGGYIDDTHDCSNGLEDTELRALASARAW